jgi:hypothetical protein
MSIYNSYIGLHLSGTVILKNHTLLWKKSRTVNGPDYHLQLTEDYLLDYITLSSYRSTVQNAWNALRSLSNYYEVSTEVNQTRK